MRGLAYVRPFGLRMPDNVSKWVRDRAEESEKSMNTIILEALVKQMEADHATS